MPYGYKYPSEFTKKSKAGEMSDVGTALYRKPLEKSLLGKMPESKFVSSVSYPSKKSEKMMALANKTIKMGDMG
jgi:hypothetical protein